MGYLNHLHQDPRICGAEPVIEGTRVTLRTLLASLVEGGNFDDILAAFCYASGQGCTFSASALQSWAVA